MRETAEREPALGDEEGQLVPALTWRGRKKGDEAPRWQGQITNACAPGCSCGNKKPQGFSGMARKG